MSGRDLAAIARDLPRDPAGLPTWAEPLLAEVVASSSRANLHPVDQAFALERLLRELAVLTLLAQVALADAFSDPELEPPPAGWRPRGDEPIPPATEVRLALGLTRTDVHWLRGLAALDQGTLLAALGLVLDRAHSHPHSPRYLLTELS